MQYSEVSLGIKLVESLYEKFIPIKFSDPCEFRFGVGFYGIGTMGEKTVEWKGKKSLNSNAKVEKNVKVFAKLSSLGAE